MKAPLPPLPEEGTSMYNFVRDLELAWMIEALERTHGDRARAGEMLGMNRTTLLTKMKLYGLEKRFPRNHKGGRPKKSP